MALEPNSAPPATDLPQLPRSSSWHAAPSTPVDRTGACRFLPRSHGLPRLTGGSASTTSLSRPAQASLALRPARSLARPNGGLLSRGSSPTGYPTKPLGSYHVLPTTTWVDPPSTDDLRRWGALLTDGSRLLFIWTPGALTNFWVQRLTLHASISIWRSLVFGPSSGRSKPAAPVSTTSERAHGFHVGPRRATKLGFPARNTNE
jgi:hypothetical protein